MIDMPLSAPISPSRLPGCDVSAALFARYLRALALLCECQPYVDEPEYEQQLDTLLRDACAAYGLEMQHVDGRFAIALPGSAQSAAPWRAACAS